MAQKAGETFRDWYSGRRTGYEQLARTAEDILRRLLRLRNVDVLSISYRAKSLDSAVEKIRRKGYSDPERDMTDLAGVRVITFVESDLLLVSEIIEEAFHVLSEKSSNKSDSLGVDRAGYRSLHFVCDLGSERLSLPEFSMFRDQLFEIQARTAFQHAWAEVEHNRRYKFAGVLPRALQRRLNLLAGMLEIADRELAAIAKEVDDYAASVARLTKAGDLDVEVNSKSVLAYLEEKLRTRQGIQLSLFGEEPIPAVVVGELRDFGVKTLADLENIFPDGLLALIEEHTSSSSHVGLLRDAMMYEDVDRYFRDAWKNHWQATEPETVDLLSSKYDRNHVLMILSEHDIGIQDEWGEIEDAVADDDLDAL